MKNTQSLSALKRNAIRSINGSENLPMLHQVIALLNQGVNSIENAFLVGSIAAESPQNSTEPFIGNSTQIGDFGSNEYLAIEQLGNGSKLGHDFP